MATELSEADILKHLLNLIGDHERKITAFNEENEIYETNMGLAVFRELTGRKTITIVLDKV